MFTTANLTREKSRFLLARMCAAQRWCEIGERLDREHEAVLPSRFLRLEPEGEPEVVLVHLPRNIAAWTELESRPSIEVYFRHDDQTFLFQTRALGRGNVLLPDEDGARPVARLLYPPWISAIQKRSHYRVRTQGDKPVAVTVIFSPTEREAPMVREGVLMDVSGGGLAFTMKPADAQGLRMGHHLEVQFTMEHTGDVLVLRGALSLVKPRKRGGTLLGLRFHDEPGGMLERRSRSRLMEFVAAEERKMIRRIKDQRSGRRPAVKSKATAKSRAGRKRGRS